MTAPITSTLENIQSMFLQHERTLESMLKNGRDNTFIESKSLSDAERRMMRVSDLIERSLRLNENILMESKIIQEDLELLL